MDWVSDELHDILGLSDRYIAEYLVGLARKASSTQNLITKLENTGAITVNEEVRQFYHQLDGIKRGIKSLIKQYQKNLPEPKKEKQSYKENRTRSIS